jgi:hypothetical protein
MRASAAGKSCGANPRRFMPESSLSHRRKRYVAAKGLKQRELPGFVYHQIELQVRGFCQLLIAHDALEQHDRLCDARAAQRDRLFNARHRKGVGLGSARAVPTRP